MADCSASSSSVTNQTPFEFVDCNSLARGKIKRHKTKIPVEVTTTVPTKKRHTYSAYYKIVNSGSLKYGVCLTCSKYITMRDSSTTGLRRHLKARHPECYKKLPEQRRRKRIFNSNAQKSKRIKTKTVNINYDLYFTMWDSKGNKFAECRFCAKRINTTNHNTAKMNNHLRLKHSEEYKTFLKQKSKANKTILLEKNEETIKEDEKNVKEGNKEITYVTYYEVTLEGKTKFGQCRLCSKKIKMKNANTSGLKRHLFAKHPEQYKKVYEIKQNESNNDKESKRDDTTETQKPIENKLQEKTEDFLMDFVDSKIELCETVIKPEPLDENHELQYFFEDHPSVKLEASDLEESQQEEQEISNENIQLTPPKQRKSCYDKYFNIILSVDSDKIANCRLCSKFIKMKNSNTSGLRMHLMCKHKEQYNELIKPNATNSSEQNTVALPSTSTADPLFSGNDVFANNTNETQKSSNTMYTLHYRIVTSLDNVKCGICRICSKCIKMTAGNTSGLKRHLKSKHPQQYFETFYKSDCEHLQPASSALEEVTSQDTTVSIKQESDPISVETDCEKTKIKDYEQKFVTYFNFFDIGVGRCSMCRLCEECFALNDGVTSDLADHLKQKHPQEHKELFPASEDKNEKSENGSSNLECEYNGSTYVVAIYSGSESEGEDDKESVTLSLRVQKRYNCYYTMSDENGEKFGICRICTKVIKMKQSNTSGLIRHMQFKHPEKFFKMDSRTDGCHSNKPRKHY